MLLLEDELTVAACLLEGPCLTCEDRGVVALEGLGVFPCPECNRPDRGGSIERMR